MSAMAVANIAATLLAEGSSSASNAARSVRTWPDRSGTTDWFCARRRLVSRTSSSVTGSKNPSCPSDNGYFSRTR